MCACRSPPPCRRRARRSRMRWRTWDCWRSVHERSGSTMRCLYLSDYGPPDPKFEAFNDGIVPDGLTRGDVAVLATAQNIGQFEAMQRKLAKGQAIVWCDQGYGWVQQPIIDGFF